MSTQQPQGPWRTAPFMCNGERIGIQDANGKWVGEEGYQDVQYIPRFNQEHARRIVACVNACEGIGTDFLENIAMTGDTLASRFKARDETERELAAQRDELLAALKSFLRAPSIGSGGPGSHTIVVQDFNLRAASAAIAKAEGQ